MTCLTKRISSGMKGRWGANRRSRRNHLHKAGQAHARPCLRTVLNRIRHPMATGRCLEGSRLNLVTTRANRRTRYRRVNEVLRPRRASQTHRPSVGSRDRKSVGKGKRVTVRVHHGGRRQRKKKQKIKVTSIE